MPSTFDIKGARAAGYTDAEIADVMAAKTGFNSGAARQAGYADQDIIDHLTGTPQAAPRAVAPQESATDKAQRKLAEEQGVGTTMLIGAGRTFDRIGKGMQQLYYGATGNQKELADLKARAESDDAIYSHLQSAHPVATSVGESLPAMVVPIGATGTAVTTAAKLAAVAAGQSALEYGSAEERAKRAAGSAAGAVIGGVVVPKIAGVAVGATKSALKGLVGNITPEALVLAERARQLGIPVNAAQLGDGKFLKTLASSIEQMPFTGGQKTASAQRTAFTAAVANTFGSGAQKVTPEIYNAEKQRLGQQFNELAARNNLNVTPALQTKLASIVDGAEATGADDTIRAVKNIVARTTEQAESKGGPTPAKMSNVLDANGNPIVVTPATTGTPTVTIPGATYSSIDSELSDVIKAGGEKGLYAKRLQTAIREAMDSSITPADQALWSQTRTQYKNLKAVRNIVAKDQGSGDIPPTQLMHALTGTEAGKEAMAMGTRGTLGELGQIGKQFVRDTVPNSGTAQRAMAMGLIGGGGYAFGADPTTIAGMVLGGATAGRLMNKAIWSPKTIEALSRQGISLKDLANMPPSRVTQILGGITGMSAAEQAQE